MTQKQKALVICPGRGSYNKDDLGYLTRHHGSRRALWSTFDEERSKRGEDTLSTLDGAEKYSAARHTRGDNASALIYACALFDFLAIDRSKYEIVAVTGNSMGWYIALACGGALDDRAGFKVVNTMGDLMQKSMIGAQLIYPLVDDNWVEIPGKRAALIALTQEIDDLYVSIHLGGLIVFAGSTTAIDEAERRLPPVLKRFPVRLQNHAAFHSPLQAPIAKQAAAVFSGRAFHSPELPLIDGRGHIWYPKMTDVEALRDYTFGHQISETYDFTKAIRNGLREFAPEALIILGPGDTLLTPVAQCLIQEHWSDISDKAAFASAQRTLCFVRAMGLDEHRPSVAAR